MIDNRESIVQVQPASIQGLAYATFASCLGLNLFFRGTDLVLERLIVSEVIWSILSITVTADNGGAPLCRR